MLMDPRDVFQFRQVEEGPPPAEVVPGFGGNAYIERVFEDDDPEQWVDLPVTADSGEQLWGFSAFFDDAEEAIEWLTTK